MLYVLQTGQGAMKPQRAFTRQGLHIEVVMPDGSVILTAYLHRGRGQPWKPETYLYQRASGTVRLVNIPQGEMRVHDARKGTVLLVREWLTGIKNLHVYLLQVPSMRLEEWPLPKGLAESPIGEMQRVIFRTRMSPDGRWLALFAQDPPNAKRRWGNSLVVLERNGGLPRVLDSGLWSGWSDKIWSRALSLVWVDDDRFVYTHGSRSPLDVGWSLLKMADVTTGRVKTLLDSRQDRRTPGWIERDPLTGVISSGAHHGQRYVLEVAKRGLSTRIRKELVPERFVWARTGDHGDMEVVRDTVRGTEVWRGRLGAFCGQNVSPDGNLVALTVRPKPRDEFFDLYVYDGRTGRKQRVFTGYQIGVMYWVDGSAR